MGKLKRLFPKADSIRASSPLGTTIFLILGYRRNTKDDPGVNVNQDGEVVNWDYVREETVASGETEEDLVISARHYKSICGMKWSDYFGKVLKAPREVVLAMRRTEKMLNSYPVGEIDVYDLPDDGSSAFLARKER